MRKDEGGRGQPRPLSLLAKPRALKQKTKSEEAAKALGAPRAKADGKSSDSAEDEVTVREARKRARQRVYDSVDSLVSGLIKKGNGNYLAVKFLFEFAGLAGDAMDEEEEDSPLLKAYLERLKKEAQEAASEQTPDAKLNLCSDGDSQICR